jgi:hypothetical protein
MLIPFAQALSLLLALLVGHAIADGPLQRMFRLHQQKRRLRQAGGLWWPTALTLHAGTQGVFVALLTGSGWLGLAEMVCHAVTDLVKAEGYINTIQDQAIHVVCKVVWVILIWNLPELSTYPLYHR